MTKQIRALKHQQSKIIGSLVTVNFRLNFIHLTSWKLELTRPVRNVARGGPGPRPEPIQKFKCVL